MVIKKMIVKIIESSSSKTFEVAKSNKEFDYYLLTALVVHYKKITIYISTDALGINNVKTSKIEYQSPSTKQWIKHQMMNPSSLIGCFIQIVGDLTKKENGYYMNKVKSIRIVKMPKK